MKKFLPGLTILFLLLLFFNSNLHAQCDEGDWPLPGLTCDQAPILCDLGDIQGYCAEMVEPPATGSQPDPLCNGDGVVNNIIWFGFVASQETVVLEVDITNCSTSPQGFMGVQYGIYDDCSFDNAVLCGTNQNIGMISFGTGVTFTPGETYYVFFDGFDGSVCTIEVDIVEGAGVYEVADPSAVVDDFDGTLFDPPFGPTEVCLGGIVEFTAEVIPQGQTENYWWTISPATPEFPNGIITVPDGNNSSNDTYTIILDITTIGSYEICGYAYTGCDTSVVNCQTIDVVPLDDEVLDEFTVCEGDFPSPGPPEWLGGTITAPGDYTVDVEEPLYSCDYQQSISVVTFPLQPEETIYLAICDYDFTQTHQICDQFIFGDHINPPEYLTCEGADMNGCDSSIIVYIDFINVVGSLFEPTCENGQLLFTWAGLFPQSDNFTQVTFNLYRNSVLVFSADGASFDPNTMPMIVDIESGTYFLEVEVEKFGTTCYFSSNLLNVDADNLLPEMPEIGTWATNPCIQDSTSYELSLEADPSFSYIWSISPSNNLVISDDSSTVIGINWQTGNPNTTYTLCVQANNGCGLSPEICETIDILAQPIASYEMPDTICISDAALVNYDGSIITGNYNWNFAGGDINGADANSAGPFDVSFLTPGKKIITVNVNQGSCISETFIDSVEVVVPLTPPFINCGSVTDSIGFSWTDEGDYIVTVISAPAGAVFEETDSTFSVTNLNPNDLVTIEVTSVDPGFCPNVSTIMECEAQNCLPIDISLTMVDTICLDANAGQIDLNAVIDPQLPGAVESWGGNGIIDADNGIFDPSIVIPGVHQIVFSYSTDCAYSEAINIVVLEQPVSTFEVEDTICIADFVTVNFQGTFSGGSFDWDFDGGVATGNNAGPFDISWDSPGLKTISAIVGNGDCLSVPFLQTVLVENILPEPIITCDPNTTDITFSWPDIADADDYEVIINGMSQGNQSLTTFFVDGLVPGNEVDIVVIANSGNKCPSTSSLYMCEALNCTPVIVNLTTSEPFVCLDSSVDPVTITSEVVGGDTEADLTWIGDGINQNGEFDATIAGLGEHEIILEYSILNCLESDTITMTVLAAPTASFMTQDVICVSDTFIVDFDGSFDMFASFDWELNGGGISGTEPGPYKIWYNSAGTYDIELVLEENTCLSDPFIASVVVEDELMMDVSEVTCNPTTNSVFFTWPAVDCALEYIVFVNGTEQETQTGTEYFVNDVDPNSNIMMEIIAISDCACGDQSFSFNCASLACPPISINMDGVDDICFDENDQPFQLGVTATGATGNETATWIGSGMDQNGMFDPVDAGVGTHTIIYALNNGNCDYNSNITIEIFDTPSAIVNFTDPSCPGDENGTIDIEAAGGDGDYSIFVNGTEIETFGLAELPGNNYTIEVVDGNNCMYSEVVTLQTPPTQDIGIQGLTNIISGDTNTYTLNTNVDLSNITDIVWTDTLGNVICQGVDCNSIEYGPEENTRICVFLTYGDGCSSEDCIDIRAEKIKLVYIPNVFSPNEDGVNDLFFISPNNEIIEMPLLQIYNRWGEKMHESTDLSLDGTAPGWDGSFKDKSLNPGVYVYVLEVVYLDGSKEVIAGDLTIIK